MRDVIQRALPTRRAQGFPDVRMRRLRGSEAVRGLVRETILRPDQLIYPLFVREGRAERQEVPSMPGVYQLSAEDAVREAG